MPGYWFFKIIAGVAQLGEEEPNVQWTFAVRRTTGRKPGRDQLRRNEDRSPSARQLNLKNYAGVAQLVEQLICNQQVGGSNPSTSSRFFCAVSGCYG